MKKVDETIEAICDWIQKELKSTGSMSKSDLPEMTEALANLILAKASAH